MKKLRPNFLNRLCCLPAIVAVLLAFPGDLYAQSGEKITLSGRVVDTQSRPLVGVSVVERNTYNAVTTNADGDYTIAAASNASLEFLFLGFQTQSVNVNNRTRIDITLREDARALDEVVVIGYGTMDRREVTSAISHISSKDFLSVSSLDPAMLIQGKVAGVSITNTAAADPNNQASIQIRGISSRSAGLGPLIVIDGIPGGNLLNLNANDIASMDILKDGAASAIYGTRGSNGVILITTKQGSKDGVIRTSYSGQFSANVLIKELDMLNAAQYRDLRANTAHGLDMGGSTDWLNEITQVGIAHQHTLTLSGGNANSNYRVSMDYRDASGLDLRSNREEYGARASINHTTRSGLFTFSANIAPRVIYFKNSDHSAIKSALDANPTTPIFNPTNPAMYQTFLGQWAEFNPVEALRLEKSEGETKFLEWNATAKLNLLPLLSKGDKHEQQLSTQLTFADQYTNVFEGWFRPSTSTRGEGFSGEASRRSNTYKQYSLEWVTNYHANFNGHRLRAMAGYSYQYFQNAGMFAENKNFPSDAFGYNNLDAGEWAKEQGRNAMSSFKNDAKLISFFGRLSYDYKSRYFFTASLRHEGSSKFGKNHKWGNFPAVSAGWNISNESFMKGVEWIDDLKLRMDYGETGNQDFGSYLSLNTMSGYGTYYYNGDYLTVWGPAKNVNPDLRWEKGKNYNIGLDFSLLDNRLSGSLNYYNRRQQDLLGDYNVPLPPYLFDKTFVNVGTMKNSGFEFDLRWNAVRSKDFSYSVDVVGATISNKFLRFSNSEFVAETFYDLATSENPIPFNTLQRIEEGERMGNFFMWKYAGVDQEGKFVVYDKNNELIHVTDATTDDKRVVGNGLPKFTGSMTHNFNYKNWNLTLFFRGAFGFHIYNVHDLYYGLQSFPGNVMQKAYGKNARITDNAAIVDYFLERGDYLKLDMATLGYTFNFKKMGIDRLRLYFTARNLLTITGYSGVDPASFQTNGLTPGINNLDGYATRQYYPSARQFIFGVQLDF